jgi:HK97 family phage major capsid protein
MLNTTHLEGGADTSGSHIFVPEEFGNDLIKLREEYGVARKLCKMVPMRSDTRTDPKWNSGLTAYFTGENAAYTASKMQHSQVRLTARKMTCLSTYSSELNEDSVIDFGNTLASEMSYAEALKEDQCFIDGDGTSGYGHIRGLKTMFATLTIGTAPGFRDTTTSNTWAAMVIADLTSLIANVPVYAQAGMRFLCSSQFYYTVMVPLLNAAGGATGTELQNGFRQPMFQGIPVMFSQAMPVATATSTIAVYLGNFALGCSFGDRRKMTLEFSKEATIGGVNLFEYDLIAVKSSQRMDINVHSIGDNTTAGPIVALSTGS